MAMFWVSFALAIARVAAAAAADSSVTSGAHRL